MTVDNKYNLGQSVYLKTDKEKNERIVTGISIRGIGLSYELSFSDKTSWHYDFEIISEMPKKEVGFKK